MLNLIAYVKKDGRIDFGGIDFSNRKPITIAKKTKDIIVFKIPSGTCWTSLYTPHKYVPTRYMVCKLDSTTKHKDGSCEYFVTELVRFAPRSPNY